MSKLDEILRELLSEENREAVRKEIDGLLEEAKRRAEEKARAALAERYEADLDRLVAATQQILDKELRRHLGEVSSEYTKSVASLAETQQKLEKEYQHKETLLEARLAKERKKLERREARLKESVHLLAAQFDTALRSELRRLAKDHRKLLEERRAVRRDLAKRRRELEEQIAEHLRVFDAKATDRLRRELEEFERDRRLLEERRVILEKEAARELAETRRRFVERASRLVEERVGRQLREEMAQLKEDLAHARKTRFGTRLFEAFVREFLDSHFSVDGALGAYKRKLAEHAKEANALRRRLDEMQRKIEEEARKRQLAEERYERTCILSRLLSPLPKGQRRIMANLLQGIETAKLEEAFNRYSALLSRGHDDTPSKAAIAESRSASPVAAALPDPLSLHVVTGDRKADVLPPSQRREPALDTDEVRRIIELAGVRNEK